MRPSCSSNPRSLGAGHHDLLGLGERGNDAGNRPLLRRSDRKRATHSSRPSRTPAIRAATLQISRIFSSGQSGRDILKRGADGFFSVADGFRGAPDGLASPIWNVRSSPSHRRTTEVPETDTTSTPREEVSPGFRVSPPSRRTKGLLPAPAPATRKRGQSAARISPACSAKTRTGTALETHMRKRDRPIARDTTRTSRPEQLRLYLPTGSVRFHRE